MMPQPLECDAKLFRARARREEEFALGVVVVAADLHVEVELAVSVTVIAGPSGAVEGKPVGLVYFAAAARSGRLIERERRYGAIGRAQVRRVSVLEALAMLRELAEAM